jgi:hypothetical protein
MPRGSPNLGLQEGGGHEGDIGPGKTEICNYLKPAQPDDKIGGGNTTGLAYSSEEQGHQ